MKREKRIIGCAMIFLSIIIIIRSGEIKSFTGEETILWSSTHKYLLILSEDVQKIGDIFLVAGILISVIGFCLIASKKK